MSPLAKPPAGIVVTPGAGADRDHATLLAIEQALPEIAVERLTLGSTSVSSAVKKIAAASDGLARRLGVASDEIALGGRSFGGRACSVAVAEGLPAAALVLLSYPLHPPGKPEDLRVGHFDAIAVPTLLVSGRRDPFGRPDEFALHLPSIAGPVEVEWVPGAHAPKGQDPAICARIRTFLALG